MGSFQEKWLGSRRHKKVSKGTAQTVEIFQEPLARILFAKIQINHKKESRKSKPICVLEDMVDKQVTD